MRTVERQRKLEGKPPLVQFLPRTKSPKKMPKKTEGGRSSHRLNSLQPPASGIKSTMPEDAHA
jgi:hypothetical protein